MRIERSWLQTYIMKAFCIESLLPYGACYSLNNLIKNAFKQVRISSCLKSFLISLVWFGTLVKVKHF